MTAKEIIEIVKESNMWESLTQKEKQEAIRHALKSNQLPVIEENLRTTIDNVHSESKEAQDI